MENLTITPEAREAAATIGYKFSTPVADRIAEIVQLAINAATEKLERELTAARGDNLSIRFRLQQQEAMNLDHEKDYMAVWQLIKQPNETVVEACQRIVKQLSDSKEEVERLREGKFTPQEFQNLCHNRHFQELGTTAREFFEGCAEYQKKLFGHCDRESLQLRADTAEKQVAGLREVIQYAEDDFDELERNDLIVRNEKSKFIFKNALSTTNPGNFVKREVLEKQCTPEIIKHYEVTCPECGLYYPGHATGGNDICTCPVARKELGENKG